MTRADSRGAAAPFAPPRSTRLVLGLVSAAALALLVWGVLNQRSYFVLPGDVPWEDVALPRTVAGVEGASPAHVRALARRLPAGASVALGPEVGSVVTEREAGDFALWLVFGTAFAFWVVAALTLAPRVHRPGVAPLYGAVLCAALGIGISGPCAPRATNETVLQVTYLLCLCLIPGLFFLFGLSFPRRLVGPERRVWVSIGVLVLAGALGGWRAWEWSAWAARPSEAHFEAARLPEAFTYAWLASGMVAGLVCLGINARRAALAREKRQAKWILWGIAIGATPFVFLRAIPRLFHATDVPLSTAVESLGELMVPAAITVAVVRDRFLDVDVIIRRSLIYSLLALGVAGLVALVVLLGGTWLGWPDGAVAALAAGLPAVLLMPARQFVSRWVDRTFFRIRHEHGHALAGFREALLPARSPAEVGEATCRFLEAALAPKSISVALREGTAWRACGNGDPALVRRAPDLLAALGPAGGSVAAVPGATSMPEVEREDFPAELVAAGVRVVQPVARSGRLQACILAGEKADERRYVEEDLALLLASAVHASSALERAELIERATEEAVARRDLAELARQKADFFARVAHDLRTPLTAIRWSVRNLSEGLPGPINERQGEYLASVGAAADQLARLVDNLVDLGRLDLGAARPPVQAVDLAAVARDAALALRPVAEQRGASIQLQVDPHLPRTCGRTEAAFQIVINLLDNALKYAPPGSAVDVTLEAPAAGLIAVTVRDRGPGLPASDRERLFRLFERGPESPHAGAMGFGIGLHIVKSWTESLGGTVAADNHPEGGARFVCTLPAWPVEGAPA